MSAPRYPRALWRGPVVNEGGEIGFVRNAVIHVAEGLNIWGCDAWFHDPAAEVSAHFGIDRAGVVFQWVDLDRVAWAQAAWNDRAISIELMGFSGQKATTVQLAKLLELLRWLHQLFPGLPLAWSTHASRAGVIPHCSVPEPSWLAHPHCPGLAIERQVAKALRGSPRRLELVRKIAVAKGS